MGNTHEIRIPIKVMNAKGMFYKTKIELMGKEI